MSLTEQIKTIYNAKEIVAPIGTLSHNLIFSNEECKAIVINKQSWKSPYQLLVDSIVSKKPIYIDAYLTITGMQDRISSGPFLYDINENLCTYARDNGYILPDEDHRDKNIQRYIEIFMKRYNNGEFSKDKVKEELIKPSENEFMQHIKDVLLDKINKKGKAA